MPYRYRAIPQIMFGNDVVIPDGGGPDPGGGSAYHPSESFAFYWEYTDAETRYTTSVGDGNGPYFVAAPQLNPAFVGSANGPELYANDTSGVASGNGWRLVTAKRGIELKGSNETSLKLRMHSASVENGLNLGNNSTTGPDYLFLSVVSWNGGPNNDTLNKFNGHEFKWQGGDWKWNGPYTDLGSTSGTVSNDAKVNWPISRTNTKLYLLASMRNSEGRNFTNWIAPVTGGATWEVNMNEGNTVSQSTADGTPLYLVAQNLLNGNNDNEIEMFFQEQGGNASGTIVHALAWEKLPATGSISSSRGRIKEFYEYAINTWGAIN